MPIGIIKAEKEQNILKKGSEKWSVISRVSTCDIKCWHQILLQAMANLSPISIAKFGLWALSSHHFPSALPLGNEITGTEIDGSFKEDVKEKLKHYVCVCPQLPRASVSKEQRSAHPQADMQCCPGHCLEPLSPIRNERNHTLETLIFQQHPTLCCTNTPELVLHLQPRAFLYNPNS